MLRMLFVVAGAAALVILGMATAQADDEQPESSTPEASEAAHAPEEEKSEVPASTVKDAQPASLIPAPDEGTQESPDTGNATAESPADPAPEAPASEGESSSTQGETRESPLAQTAESVVDGVDRAVTPTLEKVDDGTRQLGRDLDAAIGKDSQLARVVDDVESTVKEVNTVVSSTLRETEVVVKDLAEPLRGEDAAPTPNRATPGKSAGGQYVDMDLRDHIGDRRNSRDDRDIAATRHPVLLTHSVAAEESVRQVSSTVLDGAFSAPSSGLDDMAPVGDLSCTSSSGAASGGSSGLSAVLSAGIPLAAGTDLTMARVNSMCPRSTGHEPVVAPD